MTIRRTMPAAWIILAVVFLAFMAAASGTAAEPEGGARSSLVVSLDGTWLLAPDSQNAGRQEKWWEKPVASAKLTKVPWIIQDAFPGYHGVAWYWRDFTAPANPHVEGRYLLRFWAVDYLAEVWLNGVAVGGHEGGEGPFVLDVTSAIRPGRPNLLAVRVLNPTNEPIDGIALPQIPRRCKVVPFRAGALYNDGGIVDSVELLAVPPVRVADLWVRPDAATGKIHVRATLHNALDKPAAGRLDLTVSPAGSGPSLQCVRLDREVPPGSTAIDAILQVDQPRLWELNDPYLYGVSARASRAGSASFDGLSTCCGFRDFRFAEGAFRLDGRRIFLKCSHTSTHYLVGHSMTGTVDQANCGEGLFTTFRDLKPGTVDCVFDGWYPLRWCLFVEPVNAYRNTPLRLDAHFMLYDTCEALNWYQS